METILGHVIAKYTVETKHDQKKLTTSKWEVCITSDIWCKMYRKLHRTVYRAHIPFP